MIYRAKTERELELCKVMESFLLEELSDMGASDIIQAVKRRDIHMSYLTDPRTDLRTDQTHFDIQLEEDSCFILSMGVKESERRQGKGTKIFRAMRSFARYSDCTEMQTVPSGQGLAFWPKMGFTKRRDSSYHKLKI